MELGFDLAILYRGRLASCNYACGYCPFAKRRDSRAALARDAGDLDRFVEWVASNSDRALGILFTPWGEALIRKHYQDAFVRLSHLDQRLGRRKRVSRRSANAARSRIGRRSTGRLVDHVAESAVW